jgi:hypothetical protein
MIAKLHLGVCWSISGLKACNWTSLYLMILRFQSLSLAVLFNSHAAYIHENNLPLRNHLVMASQLSLETQVALLCGRPHPENTVTPPIRKISSKQHFAAILDSLAALCVSEPQQAFAVSASIRITGVTLHVL